MGYETIQVTTRDRVTTIALNRPAAMNAITPAMHHELQAAFDAFAADDEQYIGVVTGTGERAFCAGSDLKVVSAIGIAGTKYPKNGYAGLIERFDLDKPLIAAVNGVALGGGFEVALACDLIIASETAKFGLPEPRVGAVALGAGLHRLARQIGLKQAMGMILSAEPVDARRGYELGFVNEVVAPGELSAAVDRWCATILESAPLSIRASKETVHRGLAEPSVAAAMAHQDGYPAFARWKNARDTEEGPRAFAEKRQPRWQGK
jgi:crotonobetainyl-CoA hydratase